MQQYTIISAWQTIMLTFLVLGLYIRGYLIHESQQYWATAFQSFFIQMIWILTACNAFLTLYKIQSGQIILTLIMYTQTFNWKCNEECLIKYNEMVRTLTFWEDLCLEAFTKYKVLQIVKRLTS